VTTSAGRGPYPPRRGMTAFAAGLSRCTQRLKTVTLLVGACDARLRLISPVPVFEDLRALIVSAAH
jgi:hypothetical protein